MPTPAAPCNNIYRRRFVPRGNGCAARGRVCPCARPRTRSPTATTACSFTSLNHLLPPARHNFTRTSLASVATFGVDSVGLLGVGIAFQIVADVSDDLGPFYSKEV